MAQNRKIARRYAKAFVHDKLDKKKIDTLTNELESFVNALESDELIHNFFKSSVHSRDVKIKVIKNLSKKIGFSTHIVSLFEILIKNDRMDIIADVFDELRSISDEINNRVRVKVTTAYEPSVKDINVLSQRISDFFGRHAIVERHIEKSIIGGFMLEGDGKIIDMSVKGQIERALK